MIRGILLVLLSLMILTSAAVPAQAQFPDCNWWVVYGFRFPAQLVAGPYCSWSQCQQVADFFNRHYLDFNYRCQQVF